MICELDSGFGGGFSIHVEVFLPLVKRFVWLFSVYIRKQYQVRFSVLKDFTTWCGLCQNRGPSRNANTSVTFSCSNFLEGTLCSPKGLMESTVIAFSIAFVRRWILNFNLGVNTWTSWALLNTLRGCEILERLSEMRWLLSAPPPSALMSKHQKIVTGNLQNVHYQIW